jgi:hypothetical protein
MVAGLDVRGSKTDGAQSADDNDERATRPNGGAVKIRVLLCNEQ